MQNNRNRRHHNSLTTRGQACGSETLHFAGWNANWRDDKMRISQTDAIKVTDADYRAAQKAEKLVAIELAKGIAQEIGVGEHSAVASAIWLERLIATPEDVEADDSVNASKSGPGARKTEFIKRAKALQAKHDEAAK